MFHRAVLRVRVPAQFHPARPNLQQLFGLSVVIIRVHSQHIFHVIHGEQRIVFRVVQKGQQEIGAGFDVVYFKRKGGEFQGLFSEAELMYQRTDGNEHHVGGFFRDDLEGEVEAIQRPAGVAPHPPIEAC